MYLFGTYQFKSRIDVNTENQETKTTLVWYPRNDFKIWIPVRIFTCSSDIWDPTFKKLKWEMIKVVSTISAFRLKSYLRPNAGWNTQKLAYKFFNFQVEILSTSFALSVIQHDCCPENYSVLTVNISFQSKARFIDGQLKTPGNGK